MEKRRICFPILSRAYYGRRKLLLSKLSKHPGVDLQVIVGGSALLEKYSGSLAKEIDLDDFNIREKLYNVIEGGNHVAMAKTACLTALEFVNDLYKLDPHMVIIEGDRYEQLPVAMAAAYLNKTIAHIEGGDLSGSIDESIRHSISKLAHFHFVTNEDSLKRLVSMGENPKTIFNVGSLDIEFCSGVKNQISQKFLNDHGVGDPIDLAKPYVMVMLHPVTSGANNREHASAIFEMLQEVGLQTIWFWPNSDAGTDEISEVIRHFREKKAAAKNGTFRFITNLPAEEFIALLKNSACLIGNSSAGIKECSYLGVPAVNIGDRQRGRLRAENVKDAGFDPGQIANAVKEKLRHGPYQPSNIYYKPDSAARMVDLLTSVELYTQKQFYEA